MRASNRLTSSRRRFLKGGVSAGLGAVAMESAGATAITNAGLLDDATSATVVLHDPRIALSRDVVIRLQTNGARVIALGDDPVHLWRSEVGGVLRDPQTRLMGVTRWADFLIVRGLAAETRRHVRYERYDSLADHFVWQIS
jgi:hypothetical protein